MRYAMVGLMLFLTTASVWAGTWVEDFDDGNYDGWRLVPGSESHRVQVSVVNGVLVLRHFNIGLMGDLLVLEASRNWSNYTLELRLKLTEEVGPNDPKAVGITYNDTFDGFLEGGPNTPFLLIKKDVVQGMLAKDGAWFFPATAEFTFSPETWYHLKVLVQGSHYELFIDGQHVLAYDDDTFTSGGIGLGARDIVAHFDDVRISGDSVPDRGNVTAVEARDKLATLWATLKE